MNRLLIPLTVCDFLTAGLRWLFLLALALAVGESPAIRGWLLAYGGLTLVWGLALLLPKWARKVRPIGVAGDFLFVALVLEAMPGRFFALAWLTALPLLSAGLNLSGRGLGLFALLSVLWYGVRLGAQASTDPAWLLRAGYVAGFLALGGGCGWLLRWGSDRLSQRAASFLLTPAAREEDAHRALYQLIHTMSATLDYSRLLETVLDASAQALLAEDGLDDQLVSAVLTVEEETAEEVALRVITARHFDPPEQRLVISAKKSSILRQALSGERPMFQGCPTQDPELGRVSALRSCHALCLLPLRRNAEVYGLLLFAHPQAGYFTPRRCEILQVLANQAMVAIENALLYQRLEEEKERIFQIEEEARKKLARDLHDGPTQAVSALAMRVNLARRLLEHDPKAAAEELSRVEELARRTTQEMRHMLFTLRPLALESHGLIAALEAMAERMGETYHQKVIVQADPATVQSLEANKQSVIFALVEEAVNNARKHAQAEHIWVRLNFASPEVLLLEVVDDGVGFDAAALAETYARRGSLGMVHMRERAELLEGVFQIDSKPHQGTTVRVWIPLSKEAAERLRKGKMA